MGRAWKLTRDLCGQALRPAVAGAGVGGRGLRGHRQALVLRLRDAGETVVDVPSKLSARMRVYATGQGRKTEDTDAHSIALVGVPF
jgi:hypothetical protein